MGGEKKGASIEKISDYYHIIGNLNEESDLSLLQNASEDLIRIDLGRLRSANSVGIQTLIRCILSWKGKQFEYYRCPVDFIDQVEMIDKLTGPTGKVVSIMLPFSCHHCGEELLELVQAKDLYQWNEADKYPERTCPNCGTVGEFEPTDDPDYNCIVQEAA